MEALGRSLDRDGNGEVDYEELITYLHGGRLTVASDRGEFNEGGFDYSDDEQGRVKLAGTEPEHQRHRHHHQQQQQQQQQQWSLYGRSGHTSTESLLPSSPSGSGSSFLESPIRTLPATDDDHSTAMTMQQKQQQQQQQQQTEEEEEEKDEDEEEEEEPEPELLLSEEEDTAGKAKHGRVLDPPGASEPPAAAGAAGAAAAAGGAGADGGAAGGGGGAAGGGAAGRGAKPRSPSTVVKHIRHGMRTLRLRNTDLLRNLNKNDEGSNLVDAENLGGALAHGFAPGWLTVFHA